MTKPNNIAQSKNILMSLRKRPINWIGNITIRHIKSVDVNKSNLSRFSMTLNYLYN